MTIENIGAILKGVGTAMIIGGLFAERNGCAFIIIGIGLSSIDLT